MKLSYLVSTQTNPYQNIALEEFLLTDTAPDECILYLWQNAQTVVVGRNQNVWNECKIETLTEDGGSVARRLSGGGAVFHDMGNLNFTFLTRKKHYSVEKQTEVILQAVRSFGIPAVRSGRNDLLIEGKKFSGNAFYQTGDFCYHHGTLLIAGDKTLMAKYLSPSVQKLRSNAVDSVKSRVCNLNELNADITLAGIKDALRAAFAQVYQGEVHPYDTSRLQAEKLALATEKFASWGWVYGRKIPFNTSWTANVAGETLEIQCEVSQGIIKDIAVWTDALDDTISARIEGALKNIPFRKTQMKEALGTLADIVEGEE